MKPRASGPTPREWPYSLAKPREPSDKGPTGWGRYMGAQNAPNRNQRKDKPNG